MDLFIQKVNKKPNYCSCIDVCVPVAGGLHICLNSLHMTGLQLRFIANSLCFFFFFLCFLNNIFKEIVFLS